MSEAHETHSGQLAAARRVVDMLRNAKEEKLSELPLCASPAQAAEIQKTLESLDRLIARFSRGTLH
jgi:hypothetical protein